MNNLDKQIIKATESAIDRIGFEEDLNKNVLDLAKEKAQDLRVSESFKILFQPFDENSEEVITNIAYRLIEGGE